MDNDLKILVIKKKMKLHKKTKWHRTQLREGNRK